MRRGTHPTYIYENFIIIFSHPTSALFKSRGKAYNNFTRFLDTPFSRSETRLRCIYRRLFHDLPAVYGKGMDVGVLTFIRTFSRRNSCLLRARAQWQRNQDIFSRAWSLFLSLSFFRIDRKRNIIFPFSLGGTYMRWKHMNTRRTISIFFFKDLCHWNKFDGKFVRYSHWWRSPRT